jgi:chemotaxis protein histidine kinase CheA
MVLSPADHLRRVKSLASESSHRVDWKRVNEASEARISLKRARTSFVQEASASFRSLSASDGEEPAFRSLSAADEEELEQEAATVYRSVTSSAAPTEAAFVAPPTVSDEDRQVAQALNTLKKKPKDDAEEKAHWDMAMKFGETVDTLRAKTAPAIVEQMDAAFKTTVVGTEQQPLAYLVAKGFDQSSKYMLAEAEKAEKAELAAAATEFLEQERRVVQEAAATERAQPQADCYNSTCVICFEELPAGDTRVIKCKHGYCNRCWDMYLDHHGRSCAVCKTSLDPSDYARSDGHVNPGVEDDDELDARIATAWTDGRGRPLVADGGDDDDGYPNQWGRSLGGERSPTEPVFSSLGPERPLAPAAYRNLTALD